MLDGHRAFFLQMGDASHVGRQNLLRALGHQVLEFALLKRLGEHGLEHRVRPRRATAQVCIVRRWGDVKAQLL